jgi:antitoxin HicB
MNTQDTQQTDYPFTLRLLSEEDGGGYLIEFPDLPGCISDGETVEEAIENGRDAVQSWIHAANENNMTVPVPGQSQNLNHYSGKFVQRLPKSLHMKLSETAKAEGISINQLALSLIAEGLGQRHGHPPSNIS